MYQKKREHRARESTEYGILCTCTCSSATSSREARDSGVDMGIGRFIGVFWLGAWYGVATKFHRLSSEAVNLVQIEEGMSLARVWVENAT